MGSKLAMIPMPRRPLYDFCLGLFGVHAVTCWDDPMSKGVTVVLGHRWWTWRGLRDKNRRRVMVEIVEGNRGDLSYIEVL